MSSYRVRPLTGLKAVARWVINPVSVGGVASISKIDYALRGPEFSRKVTQMRSHHDGVRILAERPDLGAVVNDLDYLALLPEGSLGRAYHAFVTAPGVVPDYLLAAMMYRGPEWDALDWDADMRYLYERMRHTHDLIHALSGYGTDLASEALNIGFKFGIEGTHRRRAFGISALTNATLRPTVGRVAWRRHMMGAYRRGAAAAVIRPFHCTYFEELLPRPLDEVRAEWGIVPLPAPLDTRGWLGSPLARRMAHGYADPGSRPGGAKGEFLELADRLVKSGVSVRVIANLDQATIARMIELDRAGASVETLAGAAEPARGTAS